MDKKRYIKFLKTVYAKKSEGYIFFRRKNFETYCDMCYSVKIGIAQIEYRTNKTKKGQTVRYYISGGVCDSCDDKIGDIGTLGFHPYQHPVIKQARNKHRELIQEYLKIPKNISKGEQKLRKIVDKIFPNTKKLYNSNIVDGKKYYELDILLPNLNLAFEHNGIQHYKYVPHFHRTKENFEQLKKRDTKKRKLCKKQGIALIITDDRKLLTKIHIQELIERKT